VSIALVVNPHSGGGSTARKLPQIVAAVERMGTAAVYPTTGPGDGIRQARRAVEEGHERVIAVGGDGTINEVVNGLFQGKTLTREGVVFGVIHAGTGGDFVKSLRVPAGLQEAAELAVSGVPRAIDVMHVSFVDHDGEPAERLCINVLGFGMNGEVVRRANASSKRWGGRLTFAGATLGALVAYTPPRVEVQWEGPEGEGAWSGPLSSAFVANGAYCGGGMWVGRGGRLDDGAAELTLIPELPIARAILATPHLYRGTTPNVKGVSSAKVQKLLAEGRDQAPVLVDLDGEQPGVLPMRVEILGKVLLVAGQLAY